MFEVVTSSLIEKRVSLRGFPVVSHSNFSRVMIDIMVIYNARSWKKTKQKIKKMPVIKP